MSSAKPIGEVVDFFYRVEFQQRGWPHIHCLFWIKDAPKFGVSPESDVISFIDRYVSCDMPSQTEHPVLHEIVTNVQTHSKAHSKSCRKAGKTCRFNFPKLPSQTTFIAKPDSNKDSTSDNTLDMQSASKLIQNMWNSFNYDGNCTHNTQEIFQQANITQNDLQEAVQTTVHKETIFYQRQPSSIWVNNYNATLLEAWNANMDIQYVLDAYSCIMYIVSYISKAEREMGQLLKSAQEEAREGNSNVMDELRQLGSMYLNHREVSVMESVYRITGMHMKQCSRQVVFIPTDPDSYRLSIPLSQLHMKQDTNEIWLPNIVDKYLQRPLNTTFKSMCLATFASEYRFISQSSPLEQDMNDTEHGTTTLGNDHGTAKKRMKNSAIIRYPRVRIQKDREKYYQSIMLLYLPITKRDFKPSSFLTFEDYFLRGSYCDTHIQEVVKNNMLRYEPLAKDIDDLWEQLQSSTNQEHAGAELFPHAEEERLEDASELESQLTDIEPQEQQEAILELPNNTDVNGHQNDQSGILGSIETVHLPFTQDDITTMLRGLNKEQRQLFNHVHNWTKRKIQDNTAKPLHIFLTGGAGTGKSQVIKCITHESRKLFTRIAESPDDITVLLVAFTGTAAFNINGQTIHSALNIFSTSLPYKPLGEDCLNTLRVKYRSLQLLVIDEVSMVDQNMLTYIHARLQQIKRSSCKDPFGNVSILAVGDFHQIQPVRGKPLFKQDLGSFLDLWGLLSIWTLSTIMPQKDDLLFAQLLNRLRTRGKFTSIQPDDVTLLRSCIVSQIPNDAPFIAAKRKDVDQQNTNMLQTIDSPIEVIKAADICRTKSGILKKLPLEVTVAQNARVMLTANIDVSDGLVNGVTGIVTSIIHGSLPHGQPEAICVMFDNPRVGRQWRNKNPPPRNVHKCSIVLRPHKEIYRIRLNHVTRYQYPLKLAWALTIHKVQGMTMETATISLDGIFQAGMAYVALSRVTSLQGLKIYNFRSDLIYCNELVESALISMTPCDVYASNPLLCKPTSMNFSLIHHNVQSLPAHYSDVISNNEFMAADVICLSETWLTRQHMNNFDITGYNFHSSQLQGRGNGVAVYVKQIHAYKVHVLSTGKCSSLLITISTTPSFLILLIYKPPSTTSGQFSDILNKLLLEMENYKTDYKIIVGDLNHDHATLPTICNLQSYKQLIGEPTTTNNTLLDPIYITPVPSCYVSGVLNTYYSYHEPVYFATNISH